MKNILRRLYWFFLQLGFDPKRFIRAVSGLPRYFCEFARFKKIYAGRVVFHPCFHDRYEEAGMTENEYFWQDLYVARHIYQANPKRHVDIGSRLDGFIAHVASFREIEVFDVRPLTPEIPGVIFRQMDLMRPADEFIDYCDSLSCLHALEHFGLGRYGDPLDKDGHQMGLRQMTRILRQGGIMYLSVPLGKDLVEFNAHRLFSPDTIIEMAGKTGLSLQKFTVFSKEQGLIEKDTAKEKFFPADDEQERLGIFIFRKIS